ncbi:lactate dehydrogenase [Actinosynnema sp. ALI-1.44]|uniref:Ldh family oxidoreductase n=1 Tax=Actinosynnema sp. ALI-1.44 TaxID=1933779 RepID=UPI00097C7911|nr:Ldh family oxidoreductase [Actinosynnema sp. ALI-1.44]ONI75382.1 lactate dehydrogenase [Actinosynnema sp. ALI-1.44]
MLVPYRSLLSTVSSVFTGHGVPPDRAGMAAEALCHGELTGMTSHGLVNLTRLYLPLLTEGRADAGADMLIESDHGASVLVDARRTLGLWSATQAMELACDRAAQHGIAMVSMKGATHIGCAGYHAAKASARGMIGLIASNCGGQGIARPPGGATAMLGTNPLALACPAGGRHPFVLDMTDPAAFDQGDAHLLWLGGSPETGAYKGFGLGLLVEILAALVPGAALGALSGNGGRDDDIGVLAMAIAPDVLRSGFASDASALFDAVRGWPAVDRTAPVTYPGWHEGERADRCRQYGVPVPPPLYEELLSVMTGVMR